MTVERKQSIEGMSVGIIGAGPAGCAASEHLISAGANIDIFHNGRVSARSIYTTTAQEGRHMIPHLKESHVHQLPYLRVLTPRGTDFTMKTHNPYFMIDNATYLGDYIHSLKQYPSLHIEQYAPQAGSKLRIINDSADGVIMDIDGSQVHYDYVLDCTGVGATFSKQVDQQRCEETYLVNWVYGGTFKGHIDKAEMILIIGVQGGTSWCAPSIDQGYLDIVFSAYGPSRSSREFFHAADHRLQGLVSFLQSFNGRGIHIEDPKSNIRYRGYIRAQKTPVPNAQRVLAVGEAAGMARPGTGDSWRRALEGGKLASDAINSLQTASGYHSIWTRAWKRDAIWFAGTLTRANKQYEAILGKTFDRFYEWLRRTDRNDELVRQIESWMTVESFPLYLIPRILTDCTIRNAFADVMKKQIEIALRGGPNKTPLRYQLEPVSSSAPTSAPPSPTPSNSSTSMLRVSDLLIQEE